MTSGRRPVVKIIAESCTDPTYWDKGKKGKIRGKRKIINLF
jgi:hypothetical protein